MPDTGITNSDPEPTLDDIGREFPAWHCYAPGINGLVLPCGPARRNPPLDRNARPWEIEQVTVDTAEKER